MTITGSSTPIVVGRRANGTVDAPTAVGNGDVLFDLGGRGHDGNGFATNSQASILMVATQTWTPTAHGARFDFTTTGNGTTSSLTRMRIYQNGRVSIGPFAPAQQLDVAGNVRIGTGPFGCVEDRDGDVIAGICGSDARFKRDVVSFEPMLSKVAALRPVHFHWRADEFPERTFGSQQSYGLVAQEVEEVLPELVSTNAEGYKAVNYSKLPLIALQAIKELKEKNDALERRLSALEQSLQPPVR